MKRMFSATTAGGAGASRSAEADASQTRSWAFVDWAQHCSRSETIAAELGMQLIRHFRPKRGPASLAYKYAFQVVKTARDLATMRPRRVVCMSPSPLTALPVWLYCKVTGAGFAIDAHTGAFLGRPWDRLPWFQRFFSKRALVTMVTNDHLRRLVEDAGGRAMIIPDVPTERDAPFEVELPEGFNVLCVASFGNDEPVDVLVDAARQLPDVHFHVTGRPKGPGKLALDARPGNLHPTGFLSREEYLATAKAADVVVALTTRDHTMQRAAYEAIYLGKPVVVSDWPVLRDNFEGAAVFTANNATALAGSIASARSEIQALNEGAQALREKKLRRWETNRIELERLLDEPPGS